MGRKRRIFIVVALVVVGTLGALSTIRVGQRVTRINLTGIYTNLQSYNEGREGFLLGAGKYPTQSDRVEYRVPTADVAVTMECQLDDFPTGHESYRRISKGRTSQPLGGDSFFIPEGRGTLMFRRLNVQFSFRPEPRPLYAGTSAAREKEEQARMEEVARVLDAALQKGGPDVQMEDVRMYQVAKWKARNFCGSIVLLVLSLFGDFRPGC